MELELPGLRLKLPATLTTTTSNWQYNISAATPPATNHDYMKQVFKVSNSAHLKGIGIDRDVQVIDEIDPDHDETGNDVNRVAIEELTDDAVIAVYPKANDTLNLWYYRQPVDMSATTDTPDGIPSYYHRKALIPLIVLKAFRVYPELATEVRGDGTRALEYWNILAASGFRELSNGIRKSNPPRIRGASIGSSLSGSDRFTHRSSY